MNIDYFYVLKGFFIQDENDSGLLL